MVSTRTIAQYFPGKSNSGLRKLIRERLSQGESVLPLARTVALTANGKWCLERIEQLRILEATDFTDGAEERR